MNQKLLEKMPTTLRKKDLSLCMDQELYTGLSLLVKGVIEECAVARGRKKLYYISTEFFIGKLLSNNLISPRIYDNVKDILAKHGKPLSHMGDVEPEPSLGNGGLGRLVACLLDSTATLGLNGDGIGLDYHSGLFKQLFCSNLQNEEPNPWTESISQFTKTNITYQVPHKGFILTPRMYNIQIMDHRNRINTLRFFDVEVADESLVIEGISLDKASVEENLTLFLYPDDSDRAGQVLRICQQHFMVSNATRLILAEALEKGSTLCDLPDYTVIQINDAHLTVVIPKPTRLLTSEHGMEMDDAIRVVSRTRAYTNHTILVEALETWSMKYFKDTVPQPIPITEILDDKAKRKSDGQSVIIIDRDDRIHMAHIDIYYGFSVNSAAALHTDTLKENELRNLYEIYPSKFNNKTNRITLRRWLLHCNPQLSASISGLIGEGFKGDAIELQNLNDPAFIGNIKTLHRLLFIKDSKKEGLTAYLKETQRLDVNPQPISDVQIKRLREYRRQQMNALYLIHKYLEIKQGKKPTIPITAIPGIRVASAYVIAKDIIHMIPHLQQIIDSGPNVKPRLQVVVVSNYNVILAEELIPVYDISEQIFLTSKEASGTDNMKFMPNEVVTLSTDDSANVGIHQLVGGDNIYIFGDPSQIAIDRYKDGNYCSRGYYESNPAVEEAVDFITGSAMLVVGCKEGLTRLSNGLLNKDQFMAFPDLDAYCKTKEQVYSDYENRTRWIRKMLANIGQAKFFSSDRTILEYNRDIWKLDEEQHTAGGVVVISLP